MASIGLYGVTSCTVSLRRTEIAIPLGAALASVIRIVLGRVALVVVGGIVAGLAVAASVSRFVGRCSMICSLTSSGHVKPGSTCRNAANVSSVASIVGRVCFCG
jgi:hypothetical protein